MCYQQRLKIWPVKLMASSAAICSKAVYSLSPGKRELVALLLLCSECHVTFMVLLSLTVPCIGSVVCDCGISWSYSYFFSIICCLMVKQRGMKAQHE